MRPVPPEWSVNWRGLIAWLKLGVGFGSKSVWLNAGADGDQLEFLLFGLYFVLDGLKEILDARN